MSPPIPRCILTRNLSLGRGEPFRRQNPCLRPAGDAPHELGPRSHPGRYGRLLEHRRVYPHDNGSYLAELWSCQQWGDEIILLGTGTDGKHPGFFWMVGLDSNGNKRWERHGANVAGTEATRLQIGALTIGNFASGGMLTRE